MTAKVHARYIRGAFYPTSPVAVTEGTEVELTVTTDGNQNKVADTLAQIACLPEDGPRDGFSGADHDRALYGQDKTP